MLFNSIPFLIFFPIVVCITFILPAKLRQYWLLVASYFFYMCWNVRYVLLLFGCTIVTYAAALIVEGSRRDRGQDNGNSSDATDKKAGIGLTGSIVTIIAVIIVFSVLFVFKYLDFSVSLATDIAALLGVTISAPTFDLLLPVGISFFTFQSVGYLIDVYRGDIYAEKSLPRYMLFISFFPQLVAGPIERSKNLLRQLDKTYGFEYDRAKNGLLIMLWGYFVKYCIADTAAIWANVAFDRYTEFGGAIRLMGMFAFTIQIYGDFMGYSTIARGAGLVLGYRLTDNFSQPYFALSIKDFWRRWHISLSTWFRDYLYIPLGGSRCSRARKYLNLMITFLVSGLWHGANLTFVVWGGLHGIYQVIEDLLPQMFRPREGAKARNLILGIKTFVAVSFAWIFFRAETLGKAVDYITGMIAPGNFPYGFDTGMGAILSFRDCFILGTALLILLIKSIMAEKGRSAKAVFDGRPKLIRYGVCWLLVLMITLSLNLSGQEFIYFQF